MRLPFFTEPAESGRLANLRMHMAKLGNGLAERQVASFILMNQLHEYVANARHEFETSLGVKLCQEFCCCKHSTPLITRAEAEWIISRSTGHNDQLLAVAEAWLLADHDGIVTKPENTPAILGGSSVPMTPQLSAEARKLQGTRSPFHVGKDDHQDRLSVGRVVTRITSGQNASLLGELEPLTCATIGLFKEEPDWCWRPSGIGETDNHRAIAQSTTVRQYANLLWKFFEKDPARSTGGFLPTMLFATARPERFQEHVNHGRIAHAKLIQMRSVGFNQFPMQLYMEVSNGRAKAS